MFAAVAEEVELVVGGRRAVAVEQEPVAGPAVQRVPHPQRRPGGDLGDEGQLFVDVRVVTASDPLDDLRDLHGPSGREAVDGRGGLAPWRDAGEVAREGLAGEDPQLTGFQGDGGVGRVAAEVEPEHVVGLGDVPVRAQQRGERDRVQRRTLAHPERPALEVGQGHRRRVGRRAAGRSAGRLPEHPDVVGIVDDHDGRDVQVDVVLGPRHGRAAVRAWRRDERGLGGFAEAEGQGDPLDVRRGGDAQRAGDQPSSVAVEEVGSVGIERRRQVAVVDVRVAVGAVADAVVGETVVLRIAGGSGDGRVGPEGARS